MLSLALCIIFILFKVVPYQIAAIFSHIKFNELLRKPYICPLFLALTSILCVFSTSLLLAVQPVVLPNGQSLIEGLDTGINIYSPTRQKFDLSGNWQYSLDNEIWNNILIPSSIDYEGEITFQRRFKIDEKILKNYALKFVALGINYECEILINDIFIGKHSGGYTSFEFEIPTEALHLGNENIIRVIVSNKLSAFSTLPVRKQIWGWKNFAGILRDVYILAVPKLWLDQVFVRTELDQQMKQANIALNVNILNKDFFPVVKDSITTKSKSIVYQLSAEIFERFTDVLIAQSVITPLQLEANKEAQISFSFIVNNPKLWNPETPELYILKVNIFSVDGKQKTLIDQYNTNIGFVDILIDKNQFIVNGNKKIFKGVVWHEDSPQYGASLTYERMEKDVLLIKSLGANAVRFAFHSPHPYMLNLCSRYGLAVFQELPVWNVPGKILKDENFIALAEAQAIEMIKRDSRFPCIFGWGIGDQFDTDNELTRIFVERISNVFRKYDNRPIYYSSRTLNTDVCASLVDFVGIIAPRTDLKTFRNILTTWKRQNATRPLIILSYGKEVEHSNRNGYSDPMSQEAQARFFLQHYASLKEAGAVGSFVSALSDWKGERPILSYNIGSHYIHPVGLLNHSREKRLSYDVVRSLYNEERVIAIPMGKYRSGFPWAHVVVGLSVIILIGYQSLNRRFTENLKRSLLRSYNFFVDLRHLHSVSGFHTLILATTISVTLACLFSSILYHFRNDIFFDYLITYLIVSNPVKELLIEAAWNPLLGIVAFSGIFFLLGILVGFIIKIVSKVIRISISWFHVYSVAVWSAVPIIFLSPLAMSLFKIMENSAYVIPSLILIMLFLFWTCLRVLKGISVIYDFSNVKTTLAGTFILALIFGGLFFYYDSIYRLSSYFDLIVHLAQNLY